MEVLIFCEMGFKMAIHAPKRTWNSETSVHKAKTG